MSTEMTRTLRFRYDIGVTLRWSTEIDTGYRYHIVGYDFRDGQFGYMVQHNDGNDGGPLFYSAREIEEDWRFLPATACTSQQTPAYN